MTCRRRSTRLGARAELGRVFGGAAVVETDTAAAFAARVLIVQMLAPIRAERFVLQVAANMPGHKCAWHYNVTRLRFKPPFGLPTSSGVHAVPWVTTPLLRFHQ